MQKTTTLIVSFFLCFTIAFGQAPKYTPKHLVNTYDTSEFKVIKPPKNGFARTYLLISPDVWDTDDNITTHVRRAGPALVCIEGPYKNGQKNGTFNAYLIDSADHSKRYKIWEQFYANDKLNGAWNTYNLKGTIVSVQNFKDDSLNGVARQFWIDGKRIMEEREYFGSSRKYLVREFNDAGKLERELMFENGALNGTSKRYYETGKVKEEIVFLNGEFHGKRKYYYPSGSIWTETEYKNGKSWKVISNFDNKGNKRNPGTLNNGNGTLILYNEDGSVRETLTYKDGEQQ